METQNTAILNYLKAGNKITALKALKFFGCLRLSGRIYDLKKQGHKIQSNFTTSTYLGEVKRYKEYYI
jgi:hypothetical protein